MLLHQAPSQQQQQQQQPPALRQLHSRQRLPGKAPLAVLVQQARPLGLAAVPAAAAAGPRAVACESAAVCSQLPSLPQAAAAAGPPLSPTSLERLHGGAQVVRAYCSDECCARGCTCLITSLQLTQTHKLTAPARLRRPHHGGVFPRHRPAAFCCRRCSYWRRGQGRWRPHSGLSTRLQQRVPVANEQQEGQGCSKRCCCCSSRLSGQHRPGRACCPTHFTMCFANYDRRRDTHSATSSETLDKLAPGCTGRFAHSTPRLDCTMLAG